MVLNCVSWFRPTVTIESNFQTKMFHIEGRQVDELMGSFGKPGQSCDYNILSARCHHEFGAIHRETKFEGKEATFSDSLKLEVLYICLFYRRPTADL